MNNTKNFVDKVTVIAKDQDGLDVKNYVFQFMTEKGLDIRQAITNAVKDFCNTPEGREVYENNCNCFNWGDVFAYLPDEFCIKHGFVLVPQNGSILDVDFNEQFFNDNDISDDDNITEDLSSNIENRIIIAGSRTFDDYDRLASRITHFIKDKKNVSIISGLAKGADLLGKKFAEENNIKCYEFPANWEKYGKRAGYIRNNEMLEFASSDGCKCTVIAFWDGKSNGTKHILENAQKKDIDTIIYMF